MENRENNPVSRLGVSMARPRKANVVRDAGTGRSRGENEAPYRALRLAYRAREMGKDGLGKADPGDPLGGYTLGRLRLADRQWPGGPLGISPEQYQAGMAWAALCRQHALIMGYELKPPKSPANFTTGGKSLRAPPEQGRIDDVRERWKDCYDALCDAVRENHRINIRNVTYAVCVEDVPLGELSGLDRGDLRIGLNALARALGIRRQVIDISAWSA